MKCCKFVVFVVLFAVIACPAVAEETAVAPQEKAQAVDPSGTWRWDYEWQGETHKDALKLNLAKEGKIEGVYVGNNDRIIAIKSGKIDGDTISVEVPFEYEGSEYPLSFSGKIEKDQVSGVVVIGEEEFPWNPKRSVTLGDMLGTWEFAIETPDGNVLEPTLRISKEGENKYIGSYTSQQGHDVDVKKMHIDKEFYFLLSIATEYDGNAISVDYKARPYGDKMQGTLKYDFAGNVGDGEFSAKRKPEKK